MHKLTKELETIPWIGFFELVRCGTKSIWIPVSGLKNVQFSGGILSF